MVLIEARHIDQETRVARKVAKLWNMGWGRMGEHNPFDVYMFEQQGTWKELKALAEIRTVDRNYTDWPCIFMDLDKWFHAVEAENHLAKAALYIVGFYDGIYKIRIKRVMIQDYRFFITGRKNRPEAPNDVCPAIEIPREQFSRVCDSDGIFIDKRETSIE